MEGCEVEILSPQENWKQEIPVNVEAVSTEVPIQRIIINGQEQVMMGEACALICPKCRAIIQQFQPGIPLVEVVTSLDTDNPKALNHVMYCQKCGQKLSIMRPLPVEAEYV